MQAEACPSHVPTYTNLSPGFRNLPSTAKSSSGLQSTQNHHQQDLGNIWKRSDRLEQQLVIGLHWKLDIVGKVLFHHYSFITLIADLFRNCFKMWGVCFQRDELFGLICSDLLLNYNPALLFHSNQVVADNTYIFMYVPVIATFSSQNNNNNNKKPKRPGYSTHMIFANVQQLSILSCFSQGELLSIFISPVFL